MNEKSANISFLQLTNQKARNFFLIPVHWNSVLLFVFFFRSENKCLGCFSIHLIFENRNSRFFIIFLYPPHWYWLPEYAKKDVDSRSSNVKRFIFCLSSVFVSLDLLVLALINCSWSWHFKLTCQPKLYTHYTVFTGNCRSLPLFPASFVKFGLAVFSD